MNCYFMSKHYIKILKFPIPIKAVLLKKNCKKDIEKFIEVIDLMI